MLYILISGIREIAEVFFPFNGNFEDRGLGQSEGNLKGGQKSHAFELHPDRKSQVLHCLGNSDGSKGDCMYGTTKCMR